MEKSWLTLAEAAAEAEVDYKTLRRWAERYQLGRRVGGRWRISVDALGNFLRLDEATNG